MCGRRRCGPWHRRRDLTHGGQPGFGAHLAMDHRHRRGEQGLRPRQLLQVVEEELPVGLGAQARERRRQLLDVRQDRVLRDEPEVAQERQLLEGVEQVVRHRQLLARALILQQRPVLDLGRHQLRRLLHEQRHRIGYDQRRDVVGEVLVQVVQRVLKLRCQLLHVLPLGTPFQKKAPYRNADGGAARAAIIPRCGSENLCACAGSSWVPSSWSRPLVRIHHVALRVAEAGVAIVDRTPATLYVRHPDGHRVGLTVHPRSA